MLTFNNISVKLGGKMILDGVSFRLRPHKITAVIGKNGSGKSTLVSCITGGVKYTGEILYGDKNTALIPSRERAQLIAVLPQILPKTMLTVEELAQMGRVPYLDIGRRLSDNDRQQIRGALEITGMTEMSQRMVNSLSGGERQRAYLAMILAQNTRVIVLDEPTTYMDMENEADFLALAESLKVGPKKTVMLVIHDLTKAVEIADSILVLDGGRAVFFGSADDCVESGVIESTFGVKRTSYETDGIERPLYYR